MNRKGFTMIELLAVIIILAVLLGVTTISVFSIKRNQEDQNRENTISSILTGAKNFTAEHPSRKYPNSEISVQELIDGEYIDFDKENEKTADLIGDKVILEQCSPGSIKFKYVLAGYNDCGCEGQTGDSKKICK